MGEGEGEGEGERGREGRGLTRHEGPLVDSTEPTRLHPHGPASSGPAQTRPARADPARAVSTNRGLLADIYPKAGPDICRCHKNWSEQDKCHKNWSEQGDQGFLQQISCCQPITAMCSPWPHAGRSALSGLQRRAAVLSSFQSLQAQC